MAESSLSTCCSFAVGSDFDFTHAGHFSIPLHLQCQQHTLQQISFVGFKTYLRIHKMSAVMTRKTLAIITTAVAIGTTESPATQQYRVYIRSWM